MKIVIVSAGFGEQSVLVVDQLADALRAVDGAVEVDVDVVSLRSYVQELGSALTALAPERLRDVFELVSTADAVVLHTSIMNASFAGLLKVFLDVLPEGTLDGAPVLMVGTGGTPRHTLSLDYALRPVLTYLHAEPIPTTVFVATSDWGGAGDGVRSVGERIERAASELVVAAGGAQRGSSAESREEAADQMGSFDVSHITDRLKGL